MTNMTDAQIIESISSYKVGPDGDITPEQLVILKNISSDELANMNPGYQGYGLQYLWILLALDKFELVNKEANIRFEQIEDHRWEFKDGAGSTQWYDMAKQYCAVFVPLWGGMERSDSRMTSMAADRIRSEEFGMSRKFGTHNVQKAEEHEIWNQVLPDQMIRRRLYSW